MLQSPIISEVEVKLWKHKVGILVAFQWHLRDCEMDNQTAQEERQ